MFIEKGRVHKREIEQNLRIKYFYDESVKQITREKFNIINVYILFIMISSTLSRKSLLVSKVKQSKMHNLIDRRSRSVQNMMCILLDAFDTAKWFLITLRNPIWVLKLIERLYLGDSIARSHQLLAANTFSQAIWFAHQAKSVNSMKFSNLLNWFVSIYFLENVFKKP